MAHIRNKIRDAAALLVTGLPTTGPRVYKARTRALAANHADTLLVYTTTDTRWRPGDSMGSPPTAGRQCALVIEGRVTRGGANAAEMAEDVLDQIEQEANGPLINAVLSGSLKALGVLAVEWQITNKFLRADGATHVGSVRVEFAVFYRTAENDLTVAV
jgi:hypothetical protein